MRPHNTTGVALRRWREGDLGLLERLLGDAESTRYIGGPESPEKLRERHQRYVASDPNDEGVFVIVVGPDLIPAGWTGYWHSEWAGEPVWEIGWNVLPEFQLQGIATAGAALAIERARRLGAHGFMHAFPRVENAASNAVCRKLGFELLGEAVVDYPRGNPMLSNIWRLDLRAC